jgi:hypothetical protein
MIKDLCNENEDMTLHFFLTSEMRIDFVPTGFIVAENIGEADVFEKAFYLFRIVMRIDWCKINENEVLNYLVI